MPRVYDHCSFDTFTPKYSADRLAVMFARETVDLFPVNDVGLLLTGPGGTGKTHLAISVLREISRRGGSCLYLEYYDLLAQLRACYDRRQDSVEALLFTRVSKVDVLLIDDLGAALPTEWARDTITHVLNRRYNDRKLTLLTSRYRVGSPDEEGDTLQSRVGVRLVSRLFEMCRIVAVGPSDGSQPDPSTVERRWGRVAATEA